MLVWGKAYIASQVLDLEALRPAFGLNARGYTRYFRSSRLDWMAHWVLRAALPGATFSEADFASRQPMSFADAIADFAREQGLERHPYYALSLEGMWGGLEAVRPARDYLLGQLLSSRWTMSNLFQLERRLPADNLTAGFHIRRGDFGPVRDDARFRGTFNVPVPLEWYVAIARSLRSWFGDRISFLVVSDAPREELAPFGAEISCAFTDDLENTDISDLLSLARCDLVVCSISSYSLWAAFFSNGRYLWFAPNLTVQHGLGSIWGHEPAQQPPNGLTAQAVDASQRLGAAGQSTTPKGIPVGWDGQLPIDLFRFLEQRRALSARETDLIRYGVAAEPEAAD